MEKYLLLNHGHGTQAKWDAFFEKLGDNLIGGSALGGGLAVQGGAFSEARTKSVTGYIVIQAVSLEKAKEIALECPVQQSGGVVELFPLQAG